MRLLNRNKWGYNWSDNTWSRNDLALTERVPVSECRMPIGPSEAIMRDALMQIVSCDDDEMPINGHFLAADYERIAKTALMLVKAREE